MHRTQAFSWADTKQPPASTRSSLLCPEAAPGHCSAGVMMVQCRHCSYSRLKLSVCTLRILPTLPLMLPWKKSDHPEMYSVSSSEFAVALSSMSHSLTVTSVTTLMPWPMSESVTGTIWRLGRDRWSVGVEAPGWVERRGHCCCEVTAPLILAKIRHER